MKKAISIFFILFLVLSPLLAFGVETEINYPNVPGTAPPPTSGTPFPVYVKYLFNLGLALSGIIALAVIFWAGFIYLTSIDNPERKKEAGRRVIAGLLGLIILLAAYVILTTINPQLVILSIGEVTPTSTSTGPSPSLPTSTFVEIPLGTLVERIVAENISCFRFTSPPNPSIELLDCQSEEPLKPEPVDNSPLVSTSALSLPTSTLLVGTTTFFDSTTTHYYYSSSTKIFSISSDFRFCYTYDSDGNKSGILLNKDRYDCLANLLSALKRKSEILKAHIYDLELLTSTLVPSNLKTEISHLNTYAKNLRDHAEDLKEDAHNCACSHCNKCCDSSGCGSCTCNCSCSDDPCPNRNAMENLRNTTLPNDINDITSTIPSILYWEKEINKKRDIIRAFIFGADPTIDLWYYDPNMDPRVNPNFMPFNEGITRLKAHIDYLKEELEKLEKGEEKMKSPYGDRLTLMEFLRIKKEHSHEKIITSQAYLGSQYDITKYCWRSNCNSTDTNGVCNSCSTSTEGRICGIENGLEQFVFDGDPATFYLNENYLEEPVIFKKEKCTIDKTLEHGFPKGLIPIGQTVDQAEKLATNTISHLDNFYNEVVSIRDNALDAREHAFWGIVNVNKQIKEITGDKYGVYDEDNEDNNPRTTNHSTTTIDKISTTTDCEIYYVEGPDQLIDLTSKGSNNSEDCVDNCSLLCTSPCTPTAGECCSCCNPPPEATCSPKSRYYCDCETCTGSDICPFNSIASANSSVASHYSSSNGYYNAAVGNFNAISTDYNNILTGLGRLPTHQNNFLNEVEVLKRCKILDKLNLARERLQKCFTGFSFASKEGKIRNRVFGARTGLHLEYSGKLVILPDFPIPAAAYNATTCHPGSCLNAYPYNSGELTSNQRKACYNNKDSSDCWDAIKNYLEDYYCCQWVP